MSVLRYLNHNLDLHTANRLDSEPEGIILGGKHTVLMLVWPAAEMGLRLHSAYFFFSA